jgi:hypothetical protein
VKRLSATGTPEGRNLLPFLRQKREIFHEVGHQLRVSEKVTKTRAS